MLKIKMLLLLSLLLWYGAQSQTPAYSTDEYIEWSEFHPLNWDDFQGIPDESSFGDAGTSVFINARPFKKGKEIDYEVMVFFNKKKSWVRDGSEFLLAHEQLHFDIAELYARKVRKKIEEFGEKDLKNVKAYNAAIQDILEESNAYDLQYDKETLHGAIQKRQLFWQQKVSAELDALSDYKK